MSNPSKAWPSTGRNDDLPCVVPQISEECGWTVPQGWKLVCEKCGADYGTTCGWPSNCPVGLAAALASGDDNWLCPPSDSDIPHFAEYRREFIAKLDEAMVEDGSVASATLRSGKFEVESQEDEPPVVKGEPEWEIEQAAKNATADGGGLA